MKQYIRIIITTLYGKIMRYSMNFLTVCRAERKPEINYQSLVAMQVEYFTQPCEFLKYYGIWLP